jgi:RND family efflux transporter MFP subunit
VSSMGASPARRRALMVLTMVAALAIAVTVWKLQGDAAAQASPNLATATRGPIVVTVGGVGRIVESRLSGQRTAGATSSASSTGSASPPAGSVFPRTTGTVSRVLVAVGDRVSPGETLALVDDGGAATAARAQAEIDLETALVELPPNAQSSALALAQANVKLARQKLRRARGPADRADLAAATAEVKKARADLWALRRPAVQEPTAEAITAARTAVTAAQKKLDRLTGPADASVVATAYAELKKAEADLEALVRTDRTQPVTLKEIEAAKAAIEAARLRLEKLTSPADAADVSAAQVDVERAKAELAALLRAPAGPSTAAIIAAEQAVVAAKAKRDKVRQGMPAADRETAEFEVEKARIDLQTVRASLRRASAGGVRAADVPARVGMLKIKGAQNRLEAARTAEGQLAVRAPWGGIISQVLATPGATVDPTTPLVTVSDLDNLAVSVDLSEFDVAQVEEGMKAIVSVDALGGDSFPGEVTLVAFTGSDNGGIVTFPVLVSIVDSEDLKPGMNTSVRIIVAQKQNAIRVPLEAVTTDDEDRSFVTILDAAGQEVQRKVETGLESNKLIEIVDGLSHGTRVVLPEIQAAPEEE